MYVSVPRNGLCARLLWNGVGEHIGYSCLVSFVGWGRSMFFFVRGASFHKIHSYWEDGSPGGSDFIPQDTQLLGGRFPPGLLSKATCNVARVWRSAHGSMNWVMAERFRCSPYLCVFVAVDPRVHWWFGLPGCCR